MPDLALLATAVMAALSAGFVGGSLWVARRHRRERALLSEELKQARTDARTDPLTGIGNRKAFDERLQFLTSLHRRHGSPFSLILIDVDHLKSVNDQGGHAAGDELLRRLATILRGTIRESDFAARIGGDEFALLLPQTPVEGAQMLWARIMAATSKSSAEQSSAIPLSAGIAGSLAEESPADLLRRADTALYAAKPVRQPFLADCAGAVNENADHQPQERRSNESGS